MSDKSNSPYFDAQIWAKEFMKTLKENPELKIDESLMTHWFANAFMAGYDRGKTQDELENTDAEIR